MISWTFFFVAAQGPSQTFCVAQWTTGFSGAARIFLAHNQRRRRIRKPRITPKNKTLDESTNQFTPNGLLGYSWDYLEFFLSSTFQVTLSGNRPLLGRPVGRRMIIIPQILYEKSTKKHILLVPSVVHSWNFDMWYGYLRLPDIFFRHVISI